MKKNPPKKKNRIRFGLTKNTKGKKNLFFFREKKNKHKKAKKNGRRQPPYEQHCP
jgi:hypothetical protein